MTRLPIVCALVAAALGARPRAAGAESLGVVMRVVADTPDGGSPPVSPLIGVITGPARPIDLPSLLADAVRTDPALARSQIDVAVARASIERARAWDDWAITAGADAATRVVSDTRTWSAGLSGDLTRALSTGGLAGVTVDSTWADTSRTPGEFRHTVTAHLTQPLLRGRGEELVRAEERAAMIERDAASLAGDAAAIAVVQDVVLAYWDLLAAARALEIRRASLELARERLRITSAGIVAGGVAAAERISVEQAIATREEDILTAEVAVIERSLALRRVAGLPIGPGEIVVTADTALRIPARTWDLAALTAATWRASPDAARLRALEAGATIEVEVTERGVLPALDLALSLGPSGSADDPGEAALDLVTFDEIAAAVSLTYRTSLGEVAARATARRARLQRERVRIDAGDLERQLALAVTRTVVALEAAERRHALAVRTIDLAERALAAEQARLGSGKSRNVDVLARQDELRSAQLRQVQAVIEWHRAATTLAALTGELLPGYGITTPPGR